MNLVTLFAGRVKPGKNHSDYAFFDGDQVTDFKFRFIRAAYQGLVRRRFLHFPIVTPIYTKRFIGSVGTLASWILSYTKNVRSHPSRPINSPSSAQYVVAWRHAQVPSRDHRVVGRERQQRKIAFS